MAAGGAGAAAGDAGDRVPAQHVACGVRTHDRGLPPGPEAKLASSKARTSRSNTARPTDQLERLPALVGRIDSPAGGRDRRERIAALAAKAATTTVPIVFVTGSDPVVDGLVASLNRPGGNVTGVSFLSAALGAKRLELLRQLRAGGHDHGDARRSRNARYRSGTSDEIEAAAQAIGQQLDRSRCQQRTRDRGRLCNASSGRGAGALLVGAGAFFDSPTGTARRAGGPPRDAGDLCQLREFVEAGGLMSYGASITDAYRQAGIYAGRILKGEKPADLPVMQPTKFELVINLKTAKALGLDVPPTLLAPRRRGDRIARLSTAAHPEPT